MQKQARKAGLKIIFINTEGFDNNGKFEPYLIDELKNEDIILKISFKDTMNLFKDKLL